MLGLVICVVLVFLAFSNLLLWLRMAFLQGMCEGLINTIKGMEMEREEENV